jgi:hypothetical protein
MLFGKTRWYFLDLPQTVLFGLVFARARYTTDWEQQYSKGAAG